MPAHSEEQRNEYLEQAIRLAIRNVSDGGGPFGAVVVTPDGAVHEGVNRVTRDNDPTAHAEVVAIRRAAADTANFDLTGSVLYASCEPCPLCLSATLWATPSGVGQPCSAWTVIRNAIRVAFGPCQPSPVAISPTGRSRR